MNDQVKSKRRDATEERRYRIRTLEPDTDEYTRQAGCPEYAIGFAGLRRALQRLRSLGYDARKGDPATLVERVGE